MKTKVTEQRGKCRGEVSKPDIFNRRIFMFNRRIFILY